MIRIAVQSKGRLYEDTMNLLKEADIQVKESKRTLLVESSNFPLEVLFLRDDDIPQSVASGVADICRWPFPRRSTILACHGSTVGK